ncbi:MAG: AAA family ATPase, partial [Alphaproteobacteria bacterium]
MSVTAPLPPDKLRRPCDPAAFSFATTAELPELTEIPGQARAVEAVRFGIGIRREGYNLYALGPSGTGKHHLVRHYLEAQAAEDPVPPDWCYVNNPDETHKPRVLRLPAGRGAPLRADMERLIEDLRAALPSIFESDDYRTRRQALEEEFKEWHEKTFGTLQHEAKEAGIALVRTPVGMALAPMKEGEVLAPDEFKKLPDDEQERLKTDIARLQTKLQEAVEQIPAWEKRQREKVKEINRDLTRLAVGHLIDELRKKYADLPAILEHLDGVREDIVENARQFLVPEPAGDEGQSGGQGVPGGTRAAGVPTEDVFRRYRINLLVDNAQCDGAPVIYEDHPAYQNLVGRIEHIAQFGALVTDFNLIKPGALHRANGGYLILDARKLLMQPYAWEELKRILRAREIHIESLGQALGLVSTVSLEPEAIPLDTKIVLVGDRMIYDLLSAHDPDFQELFKVAADFDDQTDRTDA